MGASNIAKAFALYAGRVPATSMQLLVYMALVSKDADEKPWFGMGQDALARFALGREPGRAGVKAVERAIGPLFDEGAITTDRKAAHRSDGPNTARYRLHLEAPAEVRQERRNIPRKPGDDSPVITPHGDHELPPETGPHVPRFPGTRPPETGHTSPGNRGTEDIGGARRSEIEEEEVSVIADLAVSRAKDAATKPIDQFPSSRRGFGFCVPCNAVGAVTLAADPVAGDRCATHDRSDAALSPATTNPQEYR